MPSLPKPEAIHVFNDDKFIDTAITLFEKTQPQGQAYFVIVPSYQSLFKHVKSDLAKPIRLRSEQDFQAFVTLIEKKQVSTLYLHALDKSKRKLLQRLPSHIVVVWFLWGYDFYNAWPVLQEKIYLPATKVFLNQNRSLKNKIKSRLKKSYLSYRLYIYLEKFQKTTVFPKLYAILSNTHKKYCAAIKRVNIVAPVVKEEMKWLDSMKIAPRYAPFAYAYLEQLLGENYQLREGTKEFNILVGNSAGPSSNHVDTFIKLSKLNLGSAKVYVPLSYGGTEEYKNFVIENGNELLGKNFHPLMDFMPLDVYTKIISSCGILIFNHVRQQGLGNIIAMGYLGTKLYLNKRSPVYAEFKKAGAHVFSVDGINQKSLFEPLKVYQIEANQKYFEAEYSISQVLQKVKRMQHIIKEEVEAQRRHDY